MRIRARRLAIAAATIVPLAVGGLVLASIPDPQGVIHGCYKKNGQLRVIDTAQETCGSSETPLSWNQRGPAGPPGATAAAPQVIGGTGQPFGFGGSGDIPTNVGLFGFRGDDVRGWSPVPVGGTVGDFTATLSFLPAGHHEFERNKNATYTFTVMCRHLGGSASSCDGLGAGPVATPVSCSISHSSYAQVPGDPVKVVPVCSDTSGATSFRFRPGEWITVRMIRTGEAVEGNTAHWTASFTPSA